MSDASTTELNKENHRLRCETMEMIKKAIDENPKNFMLLLCELILGNGVVNGVNLKIGAVKPYIDLA
jgi:hypothetical protein